MEVDYKAIGQRIKIARIKKGVTQETVADLIDIKIVFEKEAKDIFSDCDEYEVRFLVDLMKSAKIAFRKDKDIRNQFQK